MMNACLVTAIAYVRIATANPDLCADFSYRILGLPLGKRSVSLSNPTAGSGSAIVGEGDDDWNLRTDARAQTIVFTRQDGARNTVGLELVYDTALEAMALRLERAGHYFERATFAHCQRLAVQAALITHDVSGNPLEFVVGPQMSGTRFFPSRDVGIVGLQGVGIRSADIQSDLHFWTEIVGARVSDRIGDITFLAIDHYHHRLAIYPAACPGLLNIVIEIESVDYVMQANYFLAERQVRILQGPGRDAASEQVFMHIQGQDGIIFSLASGMTRGDAVPPRPRQFAPTRSAFCSWGSICTDVVELSPVRDTLVRGSTR